MKNFLFALLSALLLSAGWTGISGLPLLVGLIPLLIISGGYGRERGDFRRTMLCIVFALGLWSAITTWWIGMAGEGSWAGSVLSVLITAVLFGAVFMLYHHASKRAPAPLAYLILIAGWIAAEYLYTVGEVSFPWLVLGNGFAGDVKLIQWYDTTGVFGGSLWVLLCNILIYHAIISRRAVAWIAPLAAVFVPIAISLTIYHTYEEPDGRITVTVVQPNFHPDDKFAAMDRETQMGIMLELAAKAPADVDYIVFPETAVTISGLDERSYDRSEVVESFRALLRDNYPGARIILGATTIRFYQPGEKLSHTARGNDGFYYDVYNSAIRIDTTMKTPIHHKSMLLIGVEKMPYAGRMEWLDNLILDMGGTTGNLGSDSVPSVFADGDSHTVAAAICWEGVFGEYYSQFVSSGADAMFIISNDSWWGETQGFRQLFKFSRLRAIETRRAIARSANTGISGFIDQRGNVLQKTAWDERTSITGRIALNDRLTFYTRHGDYLARVSTYAFWLGLTAYIAFLIFRRRRNQVDS